MRHMSTTHTLNCVSPIHAHHKTFSDEYNFMLFKFVVTLWNVDVCFQISCRVKRCRFLWPSTDYVLVIRLCTARSENGLCVMLYCVKRLQHFPAIYECVLLCMCAAKKKKIQGVAMPSAYTPNTESAFRWFSESVNNTRSYQLYRSHCAFSSYPINRNIANTFYSAYAER